MAWVPAKKRLAQFALLAFAAGEFSYAAAEVLILQSLGPSARNFQAGRRVPDNTTFTLRAGDSLVVLVGGGTRTFRGPGTFSATGAARGGIATATRRINTGATRTDTSAVTAVRRASDFWHLDVTRPGRACFVAGQRPMLWRPAAERPVQLTITPQTGAPQTVAWAQGQSALQWPASIPLADGASYQLNWTGSPAPVRLTVKSLAGLRSDDVDAVASAFLANNCRAQLDVLIDAKAIRE